MLRGHPWQSSITAAGRGTPGVDTGSSPVRAWFMFAFPLCFLQQSQAIPLISVASLTSGGSSSKAVKRQVSNVSEEEKFEKAGEALELGNLSGIV